LLDGGVDKIVVFAHHAAVIDALMDGLKDYLPVKLDGRIGAVEKQRAVDTFQNNKDCRVFVGQMQAAGVGITLTAASNVVFVESSWVSGDIAQAVDRCHRIGQKDSVLAQFLVIRGSLEEYMLRTVVDKQHVINSVIN
jgi:SWI/SNF-related matrix-associated actin-dependent regulator 1 of chromatin subfamily A